MKIMRWLRILFALYCTFLVIRFVALVMVGSDLSRSSLFYEGLVAGVILGVLKEANKPRPRSWPGGIEPRPWPFIRRRLANGQVCRLRPLTREDRQVPSAFLAKQNKLKSKVDGVRVTGG